MFKWGDWEHPIYVLILYAVIAIVDGFLLQPYIMKRTAKVPVWASILAPIVLGMMIPFWGVLLAPPLLAVLYAYKARQARRRSDFSPRLLRSAGLWPAVWRASCPPRAGGTRRDSFRSQAAGFDRKGSIPGKGTASAVPKFADYLLAL